MKKTIVDIVGIAAVSAVFGVFAFAYAVGFGL